MDFLDGQRLSLEYVYLYNVYFAHYHFETLERSNSASDNVNRVHIS